VPVQARSESYVETVAFVKLLNVLLKAAGNALTAQGRPYSHFTQFVRAQVLGQLNQREYR
jgi:deoxyribodipyrimidine photolyase